MGTDPTQLLPRAVSNIEHLCDKERHDRPKRQPAVPILPVIRPVEKSKHMKSVQAIETRPEEATLRHQ